MDGNLKYVHVAWIPAIPAGMTGFETFVYNDERPATGKYETVLKAVFTDLSKTSMLVIGYQCTTDFFLRIHP